MRNVAVHLLALFLMVYYYVGVEVTIKGMVFVDCMIVSIRLITVESGSWIVTVTFLMIVRGAGPSSGYVSTGFFGGGKCLVLMPLFPVLNFFFIRSLYRVILVGVTKKVIFYIVFNNSS